MREKQRLPLNFCFCFLPVTKSHLTENLFTHLSMMSAKGMRLVLLIQSRNGSFIFDTDFALSYICVKKTRNAKYFHIIISFRAVKHENIAALLGCSLETSPKCFLVSESLGEGALIEYLHRNTMSLLLRPNDLLRISRDICKAMEYLESKRIVHNELVS